MQLQGHQSRNCSLHSVPGRTFNRSSWPLLQHRVLGRCQQRLQHKLRVRTISAVAEATKEEASTSQEVPEVNKGVWFALVANSDFMLHDVQNEAFAEQLRERTRFFKEKSKQLDFFLVANPAWLDEQFPEEASKVRRPCVALVSTDEIWINFMKLRLDRVLRLELGEQELAQVTKSTGPVPQYDPLDKGKWTAPYPPYRPGWWNAFMRSS